MLSRTSLAAARAFGMMQTAAECRSDRLSAYMAMPVCIGVTGTVMALALVVAP